MKENLSEALLPHSFFTCLWGYYDDWVNVSFVSFVFSANVSSTWLVFDRTLNLSTSTNTDLEIQIYKSKRFV